MPDDPESEPSPRQRLATEDRREQLLALGLELFTARPYESIGIGEIAEAAGISKGLLYHYFPGKRAFYVATIHEAADALIAATEGAVAHLLPEDPAERRPNPPALRIAIDAYLRFVEERKDAFTFLLRGGLGGDAEVLAILERVRRHFAIRLVEVFPEVPPHLEVAAAGIVGMLEAASLAWLDAGEPSRDELALQLTRSVLAVMAASGGFPGILPSRLFDAFFVEGIGEEALGQEAIGQEAIGQEADS